MIKYEFTRIYNLKFSQISATYISLSRHQFFKVIHTTHVITAIQQINISIVQ